MPLTHVCMWSNHGWKHITASEAARMRPGGTVSARSGLFMCDLCGQYVTLTSGDIRDPYFKHSSEEKSKDCPERTFGVATSYDFKADVHDLPIRIRIVDQKLFNLEIGFIGIPASIIGKRDSRKIIIKKANTHSESFAYSLERFNLGGITYLSVGNIPAEKYQISYPIDTSKISSYWPSTIEGISHNGNLFDAVSGKKLVEDSDVEVNHPYYLVTTRQKSWLSGYNHVRIETVCQTTEGWFNRWYVYKVEADSYDEGPARFFLDYHTRLTDHPVDLFPIWPEYVEKPYRILHKSQNIWLYMKGEGVRSKVFPPAYTYVYPQNESDSFIFFNCNERQQLVSSGRAQVLKYMYLWKDDFTFAHSREQTADVKNIDGETLNGGEYNSIPAKGIIHVGLKVDGRVEIADADGFVFSKRAVAAGQNVSIDGLRINSIVRIFCGLDCIWTATFIRNKIVDKDSKDDKRLIRQLDTYQGDKIPVGHALGAMAIRLNDRNDLKIWILRQIRNGEISRRALSVLTTALGGDTN